MMAGKDGSRAISTINFLLDEKVQGERLRLDHTWNAHLVTANRQGNQGILKMFKSDWDDDEENENSSANSSSCNTPRQLHGNPAAHAGCAASPRGSPAPYEAPAQIICTTPAGRAAAVGTLALDLAAIAMQDPNSPIPLVLTPTAPQQLPHSSSRTCYSTATMAAAPACSITAPAPELQPAGVSTPTGLPNASTPAASMAAPLGPMGAAPVIRSARSTAENPAVLAPAPAEGSEGPEEYRAVNKALNLLWHVQATTKLPGCLQPPKPAHLQLQGSPTSPASSSSTCSTPSSVLSNSNSRRNLMPAGAMAAAGDSLDALVGGRPAGNASTSNGGYAADANSAACRASASFNGRSANSHNHVHWVQQQEAAGRMPNRSMSARNSAAAIAAVGAPGSAEPTGALVRRHTNGAVTVGISTPRSEPLYDPSYEDLKPYLAGAPAEEGLEAFIQRRLQAPAEVEMIPGTKLVKVPATQRYMAAIAVEHRHRLQQREHQALLQVAELQAQSGMGAGMGTACAMAMQ